MARGNTSWTGLSLFASGVVLASTLAAGAGGVQTQAAPTLPGTIQFNRDIRPILSNNCFACHGPDKAHRTTTFHFDVEESAKQDLGGGRAAIVPGDPAHSLLVQRITAQEPRRRMPPAPTGRALSERETALLTEWIRQGAKWEKHWSFEPPKRPDVPLTTSDWARNPIDRFVQQRLTEEGLQPSAEASRETLLRRVTLDLTGKGPTLPEIDAFLRDKSADAYERVVDRLLRSPHFGERMALPWLDAARYADSNGYQVDYERFMWRWRDWVIDAFNKNMPFDRFVVDQLAGDLLPNATLDQKVATGFNRNHRTNAEGGIILDEYAAEYVADRVATTSTVFLGVTLGCARCHDHKYDPFTQTEFYQLFAYFNNVPEIGRSKRGNSWPYIKAPTPEQQAQLRTFDRRIESAETRFARLGPKLSGAAEAWLRSLVAAEPTKWAPTRGLVAYYALDADLRGQVAPSAAGKNRTEPAWNGKAAFSEGAIGRAASLDGNSFIDAGDVADFRDDETFTLSAWIYPTQGTGAIVSRAQDEARPKGYILQLKDGKVEMSIAYGYLFNAVRVETEKEVELNRWYHVLASYGGTREAKSISVFIDGVRQATRVLVDILNDPPSVREPLRIGAGGGPENRFRGLIEEVRLYNVELTAEEAAVLSVSKPLQALASLPSNQRSRAENDKIRRAFLDSTATPTDIREAFQAVVAARDERARYEETIPTVMVMEDMPTPRETHVLLRGAYDQPGEIVAPGVPAILPAMPSDAPKNRLGLTRWIVDPSNPLTARVAVNRFWQLYFGTGLVKTADDFGSQGEPPSHPDLLDWLATELVRSGWNVKALQRLIVTSATYRQAATATPAMLQRDPENRLLGRGARFRLPAETVRDQALSISGLLVEHVGGPSVKPYQPDGLWTELTQSGSGEYVQDHGEKLYRRSLYTFLKRTVPPPVLANFDAPSRESCVIQRGLTNTPLQALNLMNDTTFLEAARLLAERMIQQGGPIAADRLTFAFRLATGRRPRPAERRILLDALEYAKSRFEARPQAAAAYLNVGEHPRDPVLDVRELAAFTSVASLVMNLDETLTRN